MIKYSLIASLFILLANDCNGFGDLLGSNIEPFNIEITPSVPIEETLLQCFKCKGGSELRKLLHYSKYSDSTSCNNWEVSKSNPTFNITLGQNLEELKMTDLTTYTVHLNGNLLLIQNGAIKEGSCKGGFFEKFVFNAVDQSGCAGAGITKQIPIYALVTITGGRCEAKCPGKVSVWFEPPVTNKAH